MKLVFQPGEEGYSGAYHMLKDTSLQDIDAILSIHVLPSFPTGVVASRPGPMLAGAGVFNAKIRGRGGHASSPHQSRDPTVAAAYTIISLQQIVSREIDPLEASVILLASLFLKNNFFSVTVTESLKIAL